ncbi:hypothetical protein [Enterobacter ludwigii]
MMIQPYPLLASPLAIGDTIGFFSSSAPAIVTAKQGLHWVFMRDD